MQRREYILSEWWNIMEETKNGPNGREYIAFKVNGEITWREQKIVQTEANGLKVNGEIAWKKTENSPNRRKYIQTEWWNNMAEIART